MSESNQDQDTPVAAPTIAPTTAPTTEFRPVEPGGETTSGATLLIEAYALMWAVVFIFVMMSWRRLKAVDGRIAELHESIRKARSESGKAF